MSEWRIDATGEIDGPIQIGMSLGEVKQALGIKYDVFRRTRESKNDIFAFDSRGIHVVIDSASRRVAGIIVFPPNSASLAGIQVLQQSTATLQETLRQKGLPFEVDDAGIWNSEMDVCLLDVDGAIHAVQIGASD